MANRAALCAVAMGVAGYFRIQRDDIRRTEAHIRRTPMRLGAPSRASRPSRALRSMVQAGHVLESLAEGLAERLLRAVFAVAQALRRSLAIIARRSPTRLANRAVIHCDGSPPLSSGHHRMTNGRVRRRV